MYIQSPEIFSADRLYSVLACTEQLQFYNMHAPEGPKFSELNGIYANETKSWFGLDLNDDQKAAVKIVHTAVWGAYLGNAISFLEENILLARESVASGVDTISTPLPRDQWQKEVQNFVDIILATTQQRVVTYASPADRAFETGNGTVSTLKYIEPIGLPGADKLYYNIRVRDSSYINFSLTGLVSVIMVCAGIIFTNVLCVPGLVFWVKGKVGMNGLSRKKWHKGYILNLQRGFLESRDIGPWVGGEGDIPVTMERGLLFSPTDWRSRTEVVDRRSLNDEFSHFSSCKPTHTAAGFWKP